MAAEQQPRTLADALSDLTMDFVARFRALHRAELRAFFRRIAHLDAAHCVGHRFFERLEDRSDDDEAFAGDAALTPVDHARRGGNLGSCGYVGVFEDEIGVGAPKLENALLQHAPGSSCDALARSYAA